MLLQCGCLQHSVVVETTYALKLTLLYFPLITLKIHCKILSFTHPRVVSLAFFWGT